jgi:hypothetical protein
MQSSAARNQCNRAGQRWPDRPKGVLQNGDDGYVPVICPTYQTVFAAMPATTGYFAWRCFQYFCWGGLGGMPRRKFGGYFSTIHAGA